MQQHHDVSPFARPFARASAPHEGQQFMQRLAGRAGLVAETARQTPAAPAESHGDWPDLDQRVRAVGEW
ncbi:hypothetical protein [Pseudorhodoferax sp.]|uniref:hypothetical protein n=1 Tax=Pseudorhodoferax sp. TaxID=1993553 RepID=UPI002DD6ACBF|nr:hypothetical protein [Pseudorhodoferax sp.]